MSLVLGWLVGLVDVAQFLPQTRRTLRMRHDPAALSGLSVWTWSIATAQALAWIVYGVADGLWAIALPNLVIAPACAIILAARLRSSGARSDPGRSGTTKSG
ncbi:PQ-loop repeat-containing protein [Nocardioides sambongensis]|uniref:hypothetical protein n=1 Tax=Nocardioides sambongensis TaxID=2589074 RepID=UPI00112A399B|nr:hypothetical protein [Nocardioides sambongensis]